MTICKVCKRMIPMGRYCKEHAPVAEREALLKLRHLEKNYTGKRVAFYASWEWKRFSAQILRDRPVCEDCGKEPSSEVHHTSYADPLDPGSVRALGANCHKKYHGTRRKR